MPTYKLEPDPLASSGDIVAGDAAGRKKDRILIGRLAESGPRRDVWIDASGEQVIAILGKRGTGKSYSLGLLVEGLSAGPATSPLAPTLAHLETPRSALVLDIMDIFWTSTIPLTPIGPPQVKLQHELMSKRGFKTFQPAIDVWIPAGFQRPNIDPQNIRPLYIRAADMELDDWASLFEVDIYGEPRGMLIADAIQHVSVDGYQRPDGSSVPAKLDYSFKDLIACLDDDSSVLQNYREDTVRSIRQRLSTFAAIPVFADHGTPLNQLLQSHRTSILMLARVPDTLKKVLVAVLLRRILRERRDASFAQKRLDLDASIVGEEEERLKQCVRTSIPRTWVLMDEAHVLAGTEEPSVAREVLVKYAKEGRNYGLSLAVATQQPSALDSRLMSQVETLIVHQLTSPRDASVATTNIRSPLPAELKVDGNPVDVEGLLRRLSQGEAMFSCGNAPSLTRTCVIGMRPRVTAHGGYEA